VKAYGVLLLDWMAGTLDFITNLPFLLIPQLGTITTFGGAFSLIGGIYAGGGGIATL
jgi:hypothetical protein